MTDVKPELLLQYADKFWDAGNSIVFGIFGLAFAVFASFAASREIRVLAKRYMRRLRLLAVIGNAFLLTWLLIFGIFQVYFTSQIDDHASIITVACLSVVARVILFASSYILYLRVLWLVEYYTILTLAEQNLPLVDTSDSDAKISWNVFWNQWRFW